MMARPTIQQIPMEAFHPLLAPTRKQAGVLQRQCACGAHTLGGGECEQCKKKRLDVQRKLMIGAINDPLELEADRMADHVVSSPRFSSLSGVASRIQRFSGHGSGQTDTVPASVDRVLAGPCRPLEGSLRKDMEHGFGYDFSQVRVHSDSDAGRSARELNAQAYTIGRDIVFDESHFAPGTRAGRHLLAHELTHVVQQGGAGMLSGARGAADATGAPQIASSPAGVLQRKWRLDRVTAAEGVEIDHTEENGDTNSTSNPIAGVLTGSAETKQTQGFVKQKVGGTAQIARWMTTHYIFKNDGQDQDFLQLGISAQFGGNAKAEDLVYGRAASVLWGNSIERSPGNPTPPGKNLFQIKGGAISAATVGDLGEIEADIPIGEKGSVRITIPLKKVNEGTFAPFADSIHPLHDVSADISEVDVQIGARVEADAEIRDDWWGIAPWISRNWNKGLAAAIYRLDWTSRAAPVAPSAPKTADNSAGASATKQVTASGRCKCVGDDACGGGKIYSVCFNTQKDCKNAQKDLDNYCNNNEEMKKKCTRPKCYYRHSKPTCPDDCTAGADKASSESRASSKEKEDF